MLMMKVLFLLFKNIDQSKVKIYEICFTLIILNEKLYKDTLEYLTAMINYVSLYHGVNDCLFVPYAFSKDYTNNYDKLVEEVEDFIKKHTVLTIYLPQKYFLFYIIYIYNIYI